MIIVVTGNVGSGKSLIGEFFKQKGANVIEADNIGHAVLKENKVKKMLIWNFGKEVVENNNIERKKLGEIAFKNNKNVRILNKITHPQLIKKIKKSIKKNKINVVVAALYYELGLDKIKDFTIVVKCSKKAVMKRVKNKKIIERQRYIKDAKNYDFIIHNSKTLAETTKQFDNIWRRIK
jgi:dephospho-CoA kinase